MLGPPKLRRLDQPIAVSLDHLVPADHFYRHLEAKLDLQFVREWAREAYADRGRPGIDPVVFFKLQLIMFFEGIRSERKLVETASLHLAHRWYLGYALDEALPDHSSLTRIRQRLGVRIFERFFERVVDLCQDAGLVWGNELFFDATKVAADADVDSLIPRFAYSAKHHLDGLFAGEEPDAPEAAVAPTREIELPAGVVPLRNERLGNEPPAAEDRHWRLLEERRLDPNRPSDRSYDRLSEWLISTTDPDATPMRTGARTVLGYHDHYVVDGGKSRIILAALVTPADVMENVPMRDLLWRVRFRRKLWPHHVTGDTTYGTVENIVGVEDAGIRAYVPLPDWGSRRPAFFGQDDFGYDAERDQYRCPEGTVLRRETAKYGEGVVVYRGDPAACNACPVKAGCTTSDRGRIVHRSLYADYLDRVKSYHETPDYQKAMRKRKVWIEPLFAEAKDWHGLRRFRLRGLDNANIQGLLVAAGQNLKRWLAATGWGRRYTPCGAPAALTGGIPIDEPSPV
jgi:transposase